MESNDSFRDLQQRLDSGDDQAAKELFDRYSRRLVALAHSRLNRVLRSKVDAEDVMQSVLRTFFLRNRNDQWKFTSWDSLWALLTVITLRKCGHQVEFFNATRRDVRREQSKRSDDTFSSAVLSALDREPSPQEAVALSETFAELIGRMDECCRSIFELHMQGQDTAAVSESVGLTERTVERRLARVRQDLQQMMESGAV